MIVDGFFEWQRRDGAKQPFLARREDRAPFALAGIWERSTLPDGEVIDACAILTGDAQGVLAEVHDRMPLIVPAPAYERWLDPRATDLADLLVPSSTGLLVYPVSALVNSPANDDPRCIEPILLPPPALTLF